MPRARIRWQDTSFAIGMPRLEPLTSTSHKAASTDDLFFFLPEKHWQKSNKNKRDKGDISQGTYWSSDTIAMRFV